MNSENPLFSITIPAYKRTFLKECIQSILLQTFTNFELIIIDDFSPEDLYSIVKEFKDSRIHYYRNEINCGAVNVVDNWNKCLNISKGKYIICMGDDDKLLPNCLEEYNKLLTKYPNLHVYHSWTEIIDEDSNYEKLTYARPEYESVYSLIWHRLNGRLQYIGDFLFHTETLKKNGGFFKLPLAWGSDDISVIIAAKERGIANTNKICFQYRINSQTISKTGNSIEKLSALNQHKDWLMKFLEKAPQEHSLDYKYYLLIINKLDNYFSRRTINILLNNFKDRILHPFFWHKKYKEFNISFKSVLKANCYAIYNIIKQR